ncbi:MAG: carboxylesterase family protein [Altererythrobacter sp.]|nr:carboxylesterase family protein [Altererythrobacter sp.]
MAVEPSSRRLASGLCAAACAIVSTHVPAIAQSAPTVTAPAGTFHGVAVEGATVFRGIHYAEAPSGALRWKPPVAKAAAQGTVDASRFGPICFQPEFPNVPTNIYWEKLPAMSEDCLSLNIWQPAGKEVARKAPVFVWIHGGSLLTGAGRLGMYDGRRLAERGVMVVSINYRLGTLGFLAHPQLSAESADRVSGNYGVLDQVEALRWVRRNIAAFGGDPDNVTIAGESAGGLSVMHLLAAPEARGLFAKAVMQSAYMVSEPSLREDRNGHPSAESEGVRIAAGVGAADIAALRAMSAGELTRKAAALGFRTYPTVEGKTVPMQLVDVFDEGAHAKVPIMAGFNSGEIRSMRMLLPKMPADAKDYEATIRARYGDVADLFLRIYPAASFEESMLQATRDALYGWTTQRLGAKQAAAGQRAYLYLFDHGYRAADTAGLRAFHGSELPYMFGTIWETSANWPSIPRTREERALSDAMVDYWAGFARSGEPVAADAPRWPAFARDERWMVFGDRPNPVKDVLSYRYDLVEHVVCRRRAAGDQQWNWNVGLAAPKLPAPSARCP